MLLFLELFPRRLAWENTFGLLAGWWRFTDFALRPHSPLLAREQWLRLLTECGFRDPGSFSASLDDRGSENAFLFGFAPPREEALDRSDGVAGSGVQVRSWSAFDYFLMAALDRAIPLK